MRKLIARVFDYSLDGLIATEDTEFFQFCRDMPDDPAEEALGRDFYAGADLHIMGRRWGRRWRPGSSWPCSDTQPGP